MTLFAVSVIPKKPTVTVVEADCIDDVSLLIGDEYEVVSTEQYKPEDYANETEFLKVEYDLDYCGGNYSGSGEMVDVPFSLCVKYGIEAAFELTTELQRVNIIKAYSQELVDLAPMLVRTSCDIEEGNSQVQTRDGILDPRLTSSFELLVESKDVTDV